MLLRASNVASFEYALELCMARVSPRALQLSLHKQGQRADSAH